MDKITADRKQIGACGLYCGACRKYVEFHSTFSRQGITQIYSVLHLWLNENVGGKCPGCRDNEKASWCKIRKCCQEKGFHTCAECDKEVEECKIHNNFIGKVFALIFRSDRAACIRFIRENGEQAYAEEMTRRGLQTMKK